MLPANTACLGVFVLRTNRTERIGQFYKYSDYVMQRRAFNGLQFVENFLEVNNQKKKEQERLKKINKCIDPSSHEKCLTEFGFLFVLLLGPLSAVIIEAIMMTFKGFSATCF